MRLGQTNHWYTNKHCVVKIRPGAKHRDNIRKERRGENSSRCRILHCEKVIRNRRRISPLSLSFLFFYMTVYFRPVIISVVVFFFFSPLLSCFFVLTLLDIATRNRPVGNEWCNFSLRNINGHRVIHSSRLDRLAPTKRLCYMPNVVPSPIW